MEITPPRTSIDWAAVNLAVSIAILVGATLHPGLLLLGSIVPWPVLAKVDATARAAAFALFEFGVPFALALLVVRSFDLAAPLRRGWFVRWLLFVGNTAMIVLSASRLAIGAFASMESKQVAGVLFWAYQSLIVVPALLGIAAGILFVAYGLVRAWWREWPTLHAVTPGEIALMFLFGAALPATALVPLIPGSGRQHQEYAAQTVRLAELCKDVKTEVFEIATTPKSVFIDPDGESAFWDVRNGTFGATSGGRSLAESLAIVGPLDYVEYWYERHKKPRELRRCDRKRKCETIHAITAKYRVITKQTQTRADEALGLQAYDITIDERETGKILGRNRFVVSWKTHHICAEDIVEGETYHSRDFIAKVLGVKPRFDEYDLARNRAEHELEQARLLLRQPDPPTSRVEDEAAYLNNRCWNRTILNQDLQQALKECDRALELQTHPATFDTRALVRYRLGRYREAIADADRALALDQNLVASLYIRGLAKLRVGDKSGGDGDIAAAKRKNAAIAEEYSVYGIAP